MNQQQRRSERPAAVGSISFRRPSEKAYSVALFDLSPQGCRIEVRARLDQGQLIWVSLPGLQMQPCRVRWTDGWTAGLEFEAPLHPSVFDHVAGRVKAA
jgi:hypothetical protein